MHRFVLMDFDAGYGKITVAVAGQFGVRALATPIKPWWTGGQLVDNGMVEVQPEMVKVLGQRIGD